MITKFDSLFAGHIDMENVGYGGTAVSDRRFPNEKLAGVFDKAQAMAVVMDQLGYHTFWMAEHHFQPEGYECIPNIPLFAVHLAHLTQRLRLQHHADVAPAAPGRGFCHRRYSHQGAGDVRRRAGLSHAGGGDLGFPVARSGGQPGKI